MNPEEKIATGSFVTNSKTDFVEEGDKLEMEIQFVLNVKQERYSYFVFLIEKLMYEMMKEKGLIVYASGVS